MKQNCLQRQRKQHKINFCQAKLGSIYSFGKFLWRTWQFFFLISFLFSCSNHSFQFSYFGWTFVVTRYYSIIIWTLLLKQELFAQKHQLLILEHDIIISSIILSIIFQNPINYEIGFKYASYKSYIKQILKK